MMIWKWAIKLFDKSLKSDNMLAVQEQVFLIQKKYNCVMNLSYNLSCGLSEVSWLIRISLPLWKYFSEKKLKFAFSGVFR